MSSDLDHSEENKEAEETAIKEYEDKKSLEMSQLNEKYNS